MPTMRFRRLRLSDIAGQVARPSTEFRLTEYPNGVIELDTPALSAAQLTTIRNYVSSWGFVEDAQAETR